MPAKSELIPRCVNCGHFFNDDPEVGRAYAFLYGGVRVLPVGREGLISDLEEAILDMGNDTIDKAAEAVAYALVMQGWPEAYDLQQAVLHHATHETDD